MRFSIRHSAALGAAAVVLAASAMGCTRGSIEREPVRAGRAGDTKGVIYGEDSIRGVKDSTASRLRASVAIVPSVRLTPTGSGDRSFDDRTAHERSRICRDSDQALGSQIAPASCSGLLVAKNLVLTAGHCFDAPEGYLSGCQQMSFVFHFDDEFVAEPRKTVPASSVYGCADVRSGVGFGAVDAVLVVLDRDVQGIEPVALTAGRPLRVDEKIMTVGYPLGTPKKTSRGVIRKIGPRIEASLDVFVGNSGGPVFSEETGELLGILAGGEKDFEAIRTQAGGVCQVPKRCSDAGCLGEGIIPLGKIFEALR